MSNLLHELENNEAILLMYLAGELPEEDRVEVEQMLASDPALRMALAELSALQVEMVGVLAGAEVPMVASRRESAVRQVSRALTAAKLQAVQAAPAPIEAARSRLRIAWWAYPIVAAAMLVVGLILLSDNQPVNLPGPSRSVDQYVEGSDSAPTQQATAQIFPADLEKELISLNGDGTDLFTPAALDADR